MSEITIPKYILEYPEKYLQCRDIGHSWTYVKVTIVKNKNGVIRGYEQLMNCSSCGTDKHRWINPNGSLGTTVYRYPDGYLIHREIGRFSENRTDIRIVMLLESSAPVVEWIEE